MILTSMQHRKRAKLLRQKAPTLPPEKTVLANQLADLHLGLARAQEGDPSHAPAAKNPNNQKPPSGRPPKPRLVIGASLTRG